MIDIKIDRKSYNYTNQWYVIYTIAVNCEICFSVC